jgi:molybdenum cofactor guanylyltransferase
VPISVGVLAGGMSLRMGQDKALLPVGGQPVIQRVLERVASLSDDVILVTQTPDLYRRFFGSAQESSDGSSGSPRLLQDGGVLRTVGDIYPGKGALGGIHSAIASARHSHCLIVACDMPFLNTDLLRYLISLVQGFDVVVPYVKGGFETMHAIYGKACLAPITQQLSRHELKILGLFERVRTRIVVEADVARLDPGLRSFLNMNTPDDWAHMQQLADHGLPAGSDTSQG